MGEKMTVLAMIVGLLMGAAGGWLTARSRGAGPRSTTTSASSGSVPRPQVETYLDSLDRFATEVTPAWSGHIAASTSQMESAVGELTAKFASIVTHLDNVLASSRGAMGEGYGQVFDASRRRLGEVVATLDDALIQKQRTLEELRTLVALNAQMKAMTEEVSRIASQTHVLALNASIEAERVGDAGRAFGVVALEVRSLANMSGTTGNRMAQMADQVSGAISGAFELAEANAQLEGTMVADANAKVQSVLDDLLRFVTGLQHSSDELGRAAGGIKDEIAGSLVQFQFQDRITQTLGHVRHSIDDVAEAIPGTHAGGAQALIPLDVGALNDRLRASYTMAEEHGVEAGGGPAPAESEITFF